MRAALKEEVESEWRSVGGKLFQTDGLAIKKDLSLNVFVFTRGGTKVRVSMQIVIVLLEYKVECDVLLVASAEFQEQDGGGQIS